MKVSDLMKREVISVQPTDKIIEIANLLHTKGFNGVPVVRDGKIIGMITEADLVSRGSESFHIPSLIKLFHDLHIEKNLKKKQSENYRSVFDATAEEIANTDYVSIPPNAEITELIKLFEQEHVNPIPVVDQENNLVGIVSLSDIIRLISHFREEEIDFLENGQEK